jgi:epsilon-lactone hydrolase
MKFSKFFLLACTTFVAAQGIAVADGGVSAPLQVPAKTLPVPTDVSPELQKLIAAPLNPAWNNLWKTGEEWRTAANAQAAKMVPTIPAMLKRLHVTEKSAMIDGVRVYEVTPDFIPPEHRDKLLIHVHGGCYELFPGESGTTEAILPGHATCC